MIKKKIVIATGGTGGHVFPAYALANYLKTKNYDLQLTIKEYLTKTFTLEVIGKTYFQV